MKHFLGLSTVAVRIGASRKSLKRWVLEGKGPKYFLTPGGGIRFTEADVVRWLDDLQVDPTKTEG